MDTAVIILFSLFFGLLLLTLAIIFYVFWTKNNRSKQNVNDDKINSEAEFKKTIESYKEIIGKLAQIDKYQFHQKETVNELKTSFAQFQKNTVQTQTSSKGFQEDLTTRLTNLDNQLHANLQSVTQKLANSNTSQKSLNDEINKLNKIFLHSSERGLSGEAALKFILEPILTSNYNVLKPQYKMANGTRVDFFISSPKFNIPIDSKFPISDLSTDILDVSATEKSQRIKKIKQKLKKHITDIADKYISKVDNTNLAFMFLPSQKLLELIYAEHELFNVIDFAIKKNIHIVGPNTLPVVLQIIADFTKEQALNDNLIATRDNIIKFSENWKRFIERFNKINLHLDRFNKSFYDFNTSTKKISGKIDLIIGQSKAIPKQLLKSDKSPTTNKDKTD